LAKITLKRGRTTSGSSEVIERGTASVAHQTAIQMSKPIVVLAPGSMPAGVLKTEQLQMQRFLPRNQFSVKALPA